MLFIPFERINYKGVTNMPSFQIKPINDFILSENKSQKRIDKAIRIFGISVIKNLIGFVLFLMGAERKKIAAYLNMPEGTFFSLLTKIGHCGLPALEDRRCKNSGFQTPEKQKMLETTVEQKTDEIIINIGHQDCEIRIPVRNILQIKAVLLTLLSNGLLKASIVADFLKYTQTHCSKLSRDLLSGDLGSLIDKRVGQKDDYRVGLEEKGEIIQQFTARIISGYKVSSEVLAEVIEEKAGTKLSPRTIRNHVQKLGLNNIRRSLPELVQALKKKS